MSTGIDTRMAAVALSKIEAYGIDATFVVDSGTASDVAGDWTPSPADVVRKVTPPGERRKYGEGGIVRQELAIVYLAASGLPFTPVRGMKVTIAGTAYSIAEVLPQYVKATLVLYELRLS